MSESLLQLYEKETPTQVLSCLEIFKNSYFEEQLLKNNGFQKVIV